MSKRLINTAAMVAGWLCVLPAVAANDWNCYSKQDTEFEPCFYAGAGLGISKFDPDINKSGYDIVDDSDSGGLVYGGYQFAPEWFVELAYADLGDAEVDARNPAFPSGSISYEVPNIMVGYFIDIHQLSEGAFQELPIDPFVKLGLAAIQNSTSPGSIPHEQQSDAQLALGAGFEWRFAKHWKLRNSLESYDVDALFFSLSVAYIFGEGEVQKPVVKEPVVAIRKQPAPVVEPVVYKPEPIPSPVIEILPPAAAECSTFEGSLEGVVFKVNSDELTDSSKAVLLKTTEVLKKYTEAQVEIQAHTDSDGSAEYNKKLSSRRAESVKAFFIGQGIAAQRLTATGFGEDKPIADNAKSEGKALNRRVELRTEKLTGCQ